MERGGRSYVHFFHQVHTIQAQPNVITVALLSLHLKIFVGLALVGYTDALLIQVRS